MSVEILPIAAQLYCTKTPISKDDKKVNDLEGHSGFLIGTAAIP